MRRRFFRKAVQLAHRLPDPVPFAAAIALLVAGMLAAPYVIP